MDNERILLRPEEVASRTGLSRSVIYQKLATGELESVKIGRARRIPVRALEAFVESLRQHPAAV